jgi:hypothetical protein
MRKKTYVPPVLLLGGMLSSRSAGTGRIVPSSPGGYCNDVPHRHCLPLVGGLALDSRQSATASSPPSTETAARRTARAGLDGCARKDLKDAIGAWADGVVAAYLDSLAAAAVANSTSSFEKATCDTQWAYMLSLPRRRVPRPWRRASSTNTHAVRGLPPDNRRATPPGPSLRRVLRIGQLLGGGTDAGTGSNKSRPEPSESTSSSYTTGAAGRMRALAAAAGLAAAYAFS